MLLLLTVPGQPISGKNHMRPFVTKNGRRGIMKGKTVTDWYDRVVPQLFTQFQRYGVPMLAVPLHVDVNQYVKHGICSTANPDGDNAQSAVWDALKHAQVIQDDSLIVSWGGKKVQDAKNPRIEIEIRPLRDSLPEEPILDLEQLNAPAKRKRRV